MTVNQLAYQNLVETRRSHLVSEAETERHNLASEGINWFNAQIGAANLAETERSHRANEAISYASLVETQRSHKASESLTADSLAETKRANQAKELLNALGLSETERSNRANEAIKQYQAEETSRHNIASEYLTANQLAETIRSNVAREDISWYQSYETARHNTETERLTANSLAEQVRSNLANEAIRGESNRIQQQQVDNNFALGLGNLDVALINAEANERNANTNYQKYLLSEKQTDWDVYFRDQDLALKQRQQKVNEKLADSEMTYRTFQQVESVFRDYQIVAGSIDDAFDNLLDLLKFSVSSNVQKMKKGNK